MAGRTLSNPRRSQLTGLRNASTRSHVYAILRRSIVSLDLPPGQALSENELAARHSVSRTPVREALIRLADEGLIEVVPRLPRRTGAAGRRAGRYRRPGQAAGPARRPRCARSGPRSSPPGEGSR